MNLKFDIKNLFKSKKAPEIEGLEISAGPQSNQGKKVAIWIKSNVFVISLALFSISSLSVAYWVSSDLHEGDQKSAQNIGKKVEELSSLERTPVSITILGNEAVTGNVAVNKKLVEDVKARMSEGELSTSSGLPFAIEHNKGAHVPIMSLRLRSEDTKRKQAHLDLHDRLIVKYDELLKSCRATLPPSEEDVQLELQRAKERFLQLKTPKNSAATTSAAGSAQGNKGIQPELTEDLTNRRIAAYQKVASEFGLYLAAENIGAPNSALLEPNMVALWFLQWKYWIAEDVVSACAKMNQGKSILNGPVKRILSMKFLGRLKSVGAPESTGEEPPPALDGGAVQPTIGVPIDPNAIVSMSNYGVSPRGWASNQFYDVYRTQVEIIVETAQIPLLANTFSKQNFIVITDLRISQVDSFNALKTGYFYGESPVSKVVMMLESVWFRQWTGPLMPDEVRAEFGTTGQVQSAISNQEGEATTPGQDSPKEQ